MKCPVCDVALSISSREGVEIDFCPQCRGVWLDRGELDKVIERAGRVAGARRRARRRAERPRYDRRPATTTTAAPLTTTGGTTAPATTTADATTTAYDHQKRKRRSFLDDIFDFD